MTNISKPNQVRVMNNKEREEYLKNRKYKEEADKDFQLFLSTKDRWQPVYDRLAK